MQTPQDARPSLFPWPPLLFAAALVLAAALGRYCPLPWPGLNDTAARAVGFLLGAAGVALVAWGLVTLYRAGTTVLPHRQAARLVTEGAFRFRRNPIYMGEVLILLGLAEATHNIWFVIVAPLFALGILALAILPEERHLEAVFAEHYLDYKSRTRRWF